MEPSVAQSGSAAGRGWALDLALLFAVLFAFYANPLILPGSGEYRGGDPTLMTYPNRILQAESFQAGILPLWNPYVGYGVPALAEYQGGFLYPLHLPVLWFGSVEHASRFIMFLHFLLQGAGMYGLARFGMGLRRPAAWFAGLAIAIGAFNAAHIEQFMVLSTACWVPAILWSWVEFLRRRSALSFAFAAAVFGCAMLAGHPQYWVYALDLMATIALAHPMRAAGLGHLRSRVTGIIWLPVLLGAALTLTAAQMLPTLELAPFSERSIDPPDYGLGSSLPVEQLWQFVQPELLPVWHSAGNLGLNPNEAAYFAGRISVFLAMAGIVGALLVGTGFGMRSGGEMERGRRVETPLWAALLLVWVVCFSVLALGGNGPLEGWFYRTANDWLPGWRGLRAPMRLMHIPALAVVLLAALGLDWIERWWEARGAARGAKAPGGAPSAKRRVTGVAIAGVAAAILLVEQFPMGFRLELRGGTKTVRVPAEASLTEYFRRIRGERRHLGLFSEGNVSILRYDALAQAARVATLEPNTGIYSHTGTVSAYVEGLLPLLRTQDFMRAYFRNFYSSRPDARLLGLMNVTHVSADAGLAGEAWKHVATLAPSEPMRGPLPLYENTLAMPRVYWAAQVADLDLAAIEGAYRTTGTASVKQEKLRELPKRAGAGEASAARGADLPPFGIERMSTNRLRLTKPAAAEGEALYAESPYPGWFAKSTAGRERLEAVNAIQMRFTAPAGVEQIDLVFEPFSFRLGFFVSLTGIAIALAAVVGHLRRAEIPGGSEEP